MSFFGKLVSYDKDCYENIHRHSNGTYKAMGPAYLQLLTSDTDLLCSELGNSTVDISTSGIVGNQVEMSAHIKSGGNHGVGATVSCKPMESSDLSLKSGYAKGAEDTLFLNVSHGDVFSAYGMAISGAVSNSKLLFGLRGGYKGIQAKVEGSSDGFMCQSVYVKPTGILGFGGEFLYHSKLETFGASVGAKISNKDYGLSTHASHVGDLVVAASAAGPLNTDLGCTFSTNLITRDRNVEIGMKRHIAKKHGDTISISTNLEQIRAELVAGVSNSAKLRIQLAVDRESKSKFSLEFISK